ncbi:hypothetical protein HanIR_Chr14g0727751 [Helianthus annuus]|nr:hypothetical protein HanIR_Chr14g0727751 [Helianthus annuus]
MTHSKVMKIRLFGWLWNAMRHYETHSIPSNLFLRSPLFFSHSVSYFIYLSILPSPLTLSISQETYFLTSVKTCSPSS